MAKGAESANAIQTLHKEVGDAFHMVATTLFTFALTPHPFFGNKPPGKGLF